VGVTGDSPGPFISGRVCQYSINKKLSGTQNRPGQFGETINFIPAPAIEPRFLKRPACSPVSVPIKLQNFKYKKIIYLWKCIRICAILKSPLFWDITQRCCRPHLSVGEHEIHSRNITCVGGHRGYACRSIDTDYQSNNSNINNTITIFVSTYLFAMTALSAQNQSQLYMTLKFFVTTSSIAFLLSCPSAAAYGGLSTSISRTQLELASVPLASS
jgi:hypothetical protein